MWTQEYIEDHELDNQFIKPYLTSNTSSSLPSEKIHAILTTNRNSVWFPYLLHNFKKACHLDPKNRSLVMISMLFVHILSTIWHSHQNLPYAMDTAFRTALTVCTATITSLSCTLT